MKSRKLTVFVVNTVVLTALYVVTALCAREALATVGVTIVVSLVGNGAAYIGGNVFYAYQRSKYFRGELNEK